jgi:hypothetical protein
MRLPREEASPNCKELRQPGLRSSSIFSEISRRSGAETCKIYRHHSRQRACVSVRRPTPKCRVLYRLTKWCSDVSCPRICKKNRHSSPDDQSVDQWYANEWVADGFGSQASLTCERKERRDRMMHSGLEFEGINAQEIRPRRCHHRHSRLACCNGEGPRSSQLMENLPPRFGLFTNRRVWLLLSR